MMNVDKKLMITELEKEELVLLNSKNPEDQKTANTVRKIIGNLKSGKYDVKVWED